MRRQGAIVVLAAMGGVAAGLPLGVRLGGGSWMSDSVTSPDGTMTVQFYRPARWRHYIDMRMELPEYVRLVSVPGNETLGVSPVVDLDDNGQLYWTRDGVRIGMNIHCRRSGGCAYMPN